MDNSKESALNRFMSKSKNLETPNMHQSSTNETSSRKLVDKRLANKPAIFNKSSDNNKNSGNQPSKKAGKWLESNAFGFVATNTLTTTTIERPKIEANIAPSTLNNLQVWSVYIYIYIYI